MDLIKQMQDRLVEIERERKHIVAYLAAMGIGNRPKISEQGLANIRAAQKKRWQKQKAAAKGGRG